MESAKKAKRKIAWLSPFPPQRSGIANYSYWLIKQLRTEFEIDLFYDPEAPCAELQGLFTTYPITSFAERHKQYDRVVYHLGNNDKYHKTIYMLAWRLPGVIVLHDYDLSGFMHEAFLPSHPELFFQAMANGSPRLGGQRIAALIQKLVSQGRRDPMSHAIVSRSEKVIVHHRWVKTQFLDDPRVEVIPMFANLSCVPTDDEIKTFKRKLGLKDNHFVLACLGFVNPNKLPQLQTEVVKRLLEQGYPVQLIFGGEPAPELQGFIDEVRRSEFRDSILFTGYQSELDYFCALSVADIIINLRKPSMGEGSLTLMEALAAGKPTIVSDANQYREFPDKVCWKLPHDENEHEVLFAYLTTLLSEPQVRAAMSANATDYVRNVLEMDRVREHWIRALTT